MQHRFHSERNKFSSLAPLHTSSAESTWWILADYEAPLLNREQPEDVNSLTSIELLQRLLEVMKFTGNGLNQDFWQSPCTRFCIGFHKPVHDAHCLYVQKRSDYLTCIELYVDGVLSVGFREPVWPHLQQSAAIRGAVIQVPGAALAAIDSAIQVVSGLSASNTHRSVRGVMPGDQSNQQSCGCSAA